MFDALQYPLLVFNLLLHLCHLRGWRAGRHEVNLSCTNEQSHICNMSTRLSLVVMAMMNGGPSTKVTRVRKSPRNNAKTTLTATQQIAKTSATCGIVEERATERCNATEQHVRCRALLRC